MKASYSSTIAVLNDRKGHSAIFEAPGGLGVDFGYGDAVEALVKSFVFER